MRSKLNSRPLSRVRPLRTALVAAMALALGGGCTGEDAAIDHVGNARKAIENREYRAAEIELKNALGKNPDDAEARLLLAEGHLRFGNGRAAETNLDKAEAAGMAAPRLMVPRMNAWMLQKKFEPVIAVELDKLSQVDYPPDVRAEILALQGDAHLALKELDRAKEKYAAALTLDPDSGPALVGEAQLAVRAKDNERGLELARRATQMAPAYAPGWSVLGDLLRQDGDLPAAEEAYTQAIKFRETNREDLLSRAMVQISRNDLEGALADAETLRKRGHAIPHATFISGIVNLAKAKPEAAREDFEQVVANAPRYIVAACYLGQSHATTGNYEQSAAHLAKCQKYYGNNGAVRRLYAGVLAAAGRESEAAAVLSPFIEANQGEAEDIELLARMRLLQGDAKQAVSLLQRLLDANGGSSATYLNLGYALVAAGELEESKAAFAEAGKLRKADTSQTGEDESYGLLEARALLQSGNTKAAIARLESQVSAEPENRQAANLLALALIRSGQRVEARALLEKILAQEPDYAIGVINLASLKAQDGELEAARTLLLPLLEKEPDNSQVLGMLSAIDVRLGNDEAVLPRVEEAIRKSPEDSGLRLLRARTLKSQGRLNDALEVYEELVTRPKPDPLWLRELVSAQLAANQSMAALETGRRLVSLRAALAEDHLLLRKIMLSTGDIEGASRVLRDALERYPENLELRLARIEELTFSGDFPDARRLMNETKAGMAKREVPDLLIMEALILAQEGKGEQAVEAAQRAFELDPVAQRLIDLARVQGSMGRAAEAVVKLQEWVNNHPGDHAVLFVLADAHAKREDYDAARAAYTTLLALNPDHPWALNNLAWLLRETDPAQALALAERALEKAPRAPGVMDTLGMLLLTREETGRSLELLRQASLLAPSNNEIKLHLAEALLAAGSREEALTVAQALAGQPLPPKAEEEYGRLKQQLGL